MPRWYKDLGTRDGCTRVALTQAVVFAVLQGLAAVFPVGVSAHFALLAAFTNWPLPTAVSAVAAQGGVILALLAYFWSDLFDMAAGVVRAAKGKRDPGARLAAQILVAGIATAALMFVIDRYAGDAAESLIWIGWLSVGGGASLLVLDRMSMTVKRVDHATFADAVLLGLAQAIALFPHMRSAGAPVTVGRLLGYERDEAVRLSMLSAALPLIGMLAKTLIDAHGSGAPIEFGRTDLIAGGVSFVMALASLATLMTWLKRSSFTPFAVYRLLVGTAVLVLAYGAIEL